MTAPSIGLAPSSQHSPLHCLTSPARQPVRLARPCSVPAHIPLRGRLGLLRSKAPDIGYHVRQTGRVARNGAPARDSAAGGIIGSKAPARPVISKGTTGRNQGGDRGTPLKVLSPMSPTCPAGQKCNCPVVSRLSLHRFLSPTFSP
jgi:hypothetical protein